METGEAETIPADMDEVRQQFEKWRSTHTRRSRIPETLWASAVKLAGQHGLHRTAKILHLDYTKLKRLVDGKSAGQQATATAFVELFSPTGNSTAECIVELENARGKKMRIQLRGEAVPDVAQLSRIFWSTRA